MMVRLLSLSSSFPYCMYHRLHVFIYNRSKKRAEVAGWCDSMYFSVSLRKVIVLYFSSVVLLLEFRFSHVDVDATPVG